MIKEASIGNLPILKPNWRLIIERQRAASQSVNTILVHTYWLIGRHIVEFEQGCKEKAEYGSFIFEQLSKDLTRLYGKGFSRANLLYMRKIYRKFTKSETMSNVLMKGLK